MTIPLNLIRIFFLSFLISLAMKPAMAQTLATREPGNTSFRYGGMQKEHLVFYVHVENDSRERLRFLIRDENNNVLFEENFTSEAFEKKILLEKADLSKVSFEISGRNYNYSRQFSISTRTVEEVTVSENVK
ncbi:MAG: hypothetical protein ABIR30_07325 [Chitinophagaceae bacterium]